MAEASEWVGRVIDGRCNCAAARLFALDLCLAVCGYQQPCMQNSCASYIMRCSADSS